MGRGILTGLIWGLVVGGGILTVANEVVGPVEVSVPRPMAADDTAPRARMTPPPQAMRHR